MASGSEEMVSPEEDAHVEVPEPTEVKGDGKKRKFKPLEAMRKLFKSGRKRSKLKEDQQGSIVSQKAKSTPALQTADEDDDDDGGFKNRAPRPLGGARSISEDSVFSPEQRDPSLGALNKTAISEENLRPKFHDELFSKLKKRQTLHSDEDVASGGQLKTQKSSSRESDKSLLSMDSSDNEDMDLFMSNWTSSSAQKPKRMSNKSDKTEPMDFGAVKSTQQLTSDAAKHKLSVRPNRRKGTRHSRKHRDVTSPSGLPSLNEESPTKTMEQSSYSIMSTDISQFDMSTSYSEVSQAETPQKPNISIVLTPHTTNTDSVTSAKEETLLPSAVSVSSEAKKEAVKVEEKASPKVSRHLSGRSRDGADAQSVVSSSEQGNELSMAFNKVKRRSVKMEMAQEEEKDPIPSREVTGASKQRPVSGPVKSVSDKSEDKVEVKSSSKTQQSSASQVSQSDPKDSNITVTSTPVEQKQPLAKKVSNEFVQEPVVRKTSSEFVKEPLVKKVSNEFVKETVVKNLSNEFVKEAVVKKVSNEFVKEPVVKKVSNEFVKEPVVKKVSNELVKDDSSETSSVKSNTSFKREGLKTTDTSDVVSPGREDYKLRRQSRSKTLPEQPVAKDEQYASKIQRTNSHRVEFGSSSSSTQKTDVMTSSAIMTSDLSQKKNDPKRWTWTEPANNEPEWMAVIRKRKEVNKESENSVGAKTQQNEQKPKEVFTMDIGKDKQNLLGSEKPDSAGQSVSSTKTKVVASQAEMASPSRTGHFPSRGGSVKVESSKLDGAKSFTSRACSVKSPRSKFETVGTKLSPTEEVTNTSRGEPTKTPSSPTAVSDSVKPLFSLSESKRSFSKVDNTKTSSSIVSEKSSSSSEPKKSFSRVDGTKTSSPSHGANLSKISASEVNKKVDSKPLSFNTRSSVQTKDTVTKTVADGSNLSKASVSEVNKKVDSKPVPFSSRSSVQPKDTGVKPNSVSSWKSNTPKKENVNSQLKDNPLAPVKIEIIEKEQSKVELPPKKKVSTSSTETPEKCRDRSSNRSSVLDIVKNFQKLHVT